MVKKSYVIFPIVIFIIFIVGYVILAANSYGMHNFRFLMKSNDKKIEVSNNYEDEYVKIDYENNEKKTVYFTRMKKDFLYIYKYQNPENIRNITSYLYFNSNYKPMKDEIGNNSVIISIYNDSGFVFSAPIKTYILNP